MPYYIYMEKGSHTLTVFGRDGNGNYSNVVKRFCASTGKSSGMTPPGTYNVKGKMRWIKFSATAYGQYCTTLSGTDVKIHSCLYNTQNNADLMVSTYNSLGTNCSSGCLRVTCGNANWIYNNCEAGTIVQIVNGSPRGTSSSRPKALPSNTKYDPTDPGAK